MVWCSLGEEGAAAIADFVKQGKKLKELNLYMNDIGTGGAYKVNKSCSSGGHLQPGHCSDCITPWFCFKAWVMPSEAEAQRLLKCSQENLQQSLGLELDVPVFSTIAQLAQLWLALHVCLS